MKRRVTYQGSPQTISQLYNPAGVLVQTLVTTPQPRYSSEVLQTSQGNPIWKLKMGGSLPPFPKPYKGKNLAKLVSNAAVRLKVLKKRSAILANRNSDVGGPFYKWSYKQFPALKYISDSRIIAGNRQTSKGYLCASVLSGNSGPVTAPSLLPSSNAQLDAFGSTGIAKCIPTNPLANMGQFLVELRDIPRFFDPFAWKEKARHFKKLAEAGSSEYLNVEFGWLPFLSDINSFFKVTSNLTRNIQQYNRDSGRHIRRNSSILTSSSAVVTDLGAAGPFPAPPTTVSGGKLTKSVTTTQRVWFSGSFTYYLPPIDGSAGSYFRRYLAYANKLYGIVPGPDLLWKVAPWSWGIDWISNTGSVIRNWEAFTFQGLVMHYGYVMEEKTRTTSWAMDGFRLSRDPTTSVTDFVIEDSKIRRHATPYGFGLNPGSFTPFQNGIIAALGINRLARWL
jgi:hypothetical protein